jgi:hypothetical protein
MKKNSEKTAAKPYQKKQVEASSDALAGPTDAVRRGVRGQTRRRGSICREGSKALLNSRPSPLTFL